MLKRLYVDNFRCLTNFELKLDEANVLLGANATGKTTVLVVLQKLQKLLARGGRVDEVFPARDLTLSQNRSEQRFELETCVDEQTYRYGLTVEHDLDRHQMRIIEETLEHDSSAIFEFASGLAQRYHDDYRRGSEYPFDWTLSGVGSLHERPDNQKLTRFKKDLRNYIVAGTCRR